MMSTKMVTEHSFPYRATTVTGIKGFNSKIYDDVEGEMEVELSFGPSGLKRKEIFYLVPNCPSPLIGWPTLSEFGLIIDSAARRVTEQKTGLIIHCAVADLDKPKPKKKVTVKENGEHLQVRDASGDDPKNELTARQVSALSARVEQLRLVD